MKNIYEMKYFASLFKSHEENLYLQICEGVCAVLCYEKRKLQRSRSGKVIPFTQVCLCSPTGMQGKDPSKSKTLITSCDRVDTLLFDTYDAVYIFLYTKKYPLLFCFVLFGRRVRVDDTKKQKLATHGKPRM